MALTFDHQFGLHAIDMSALVFHHAVIAVIQRAILQRRDDGMGMNTETVRKIFSRATSIAGLPGDMPLMLLKARRSLCQFRLPRCPGWVETSSPCLSVLRFLLGSVSQFG